jgi:hypothetical protein
LSIFKAQDYEREKVKETEDINAETTNKRKVSTRIRTGDAGYNYYLEVVSTYGPYKEDEINRGRRGVRLLGPEYPQRPELEIITEKNGVMIRLVQRN